MRLYQHSTNGARYLPRAPGSLTWHVLGDFFPVSLVLSLVQARDVRYLTVHTVRSFAFPGPRVEGQAGTGHQEQAERGQAERHLSRTDSETHSHRFLSVSGGTSKRKFV